MFLRPKEIDNMGRKTLHTLNKCLIKIWKTLVKLEKAHKKKIKTQRSCVVQKTNTNESVHVWKW